MTGPVFTRIWSFTDNAYAEKIKHSIEPYFNVQRVSSIDNFDQIVQLDGVDRSSATPRGSATASPTASSASRPAAAGRAKSARSRIGQSYYTDARASLYDQYYQIEQRGGAEQVLAALAAARAPCRPTTSRRNFRAEYDTQFQRVPDDGGRRHRAARRSGCRRSAAGASAASSRAWPGFDDRVAPRSLPERRDQRAVAGRTSTAARTSSTTTCCRSSFLQQRMLAYYNAQCCGFAVEYQTCDLSRLSTVTPVTQDHRLNFSITLAGIGTLSQQLRLARRERRARPAHGTERRGRRT